MGLLHASERTAAGHRRYADADVRRLYRIRALRSLGLSLEAVRAALAADGGSGGELRVLLCRQLAAVDEQLAAAHARREPLTRVPAAVDAGAGPATDDLLATIEGMTMYERYYTPEQLTQLEERARELGEAGMARAQRGWAELIAALDAERSRGTDPSHPRVQELARRWEALIEQFTGGDPGIRESLQRMYDAAGPTDASRGTVSPELAAYASQVKAASRPTE